MATSTTRRTVLKSSAAIVILGLGACSEGGRMPPQNSASRADLNPQSGTSEPPSNSAEAGLPPSSAELHLLKRATWGPTKTDLQDIQSMGRNAWLEDQLTPSTLDNSLVEQEVRWRWPTVERSGCQLAQLQDDARVMRELRAATLFRRVFSKHQLLEVMVDFWTDHFTIYHGDGMARHLKTVDDREVIRANALGQFRNLLHASARSPAMLEFLDNRRSTKNKPNENYARELLELHTLGVDGGYSEDDIYNVARAFTGWQVQSQDADRLCLLGNHRSFLFNAEQHDTDAKIVLGLNLPAERGIEDGEDVLDLLADHPSTHRFIARKLYQRFVSDTEPSPEFLERIASAWGADGDIAAMLRVLFQSTEFAKATDTKLTRPQEFAIATIRSIDPDMDTDITLLDLIRASAIPDLYTMEGLANIELLPQPEYEDFEDLDIDLTPSYEGPNPNAMISRTGHVPFQWPSPDGYPDSEDYWASANGMLERWKFAIQTAGQTRSDGNSNAYWAADGHDDPLLAFEAMVEKLLGRNINNAHRSTIIDTAQIQANGKPASPEQMRRRMFALLLISPYAQRR